MTKSSYKVAVVGVPTRDGRTITAVDLNRNPVPLMSGSECLGAVECWLENGDVWASIDDALVPIEIWPSVSMADIVVTANNAGDIFMFGSIGAVQLQPREAWPWD